jgi:hypothetical protein
MEVDPIACNQHLGNFAAYKHIVAFGDIHGDMEALNACLKLSECVSEAGDWIAPPRTAIVILGDVVDRFRNGTKHEVDPATGLTKSLGETPKEEERILEKLNTLAYFAQRAGGAIIRLVGNHELMQADAAADYSNGIRYSSPYSVGGNTPNKYAARQMSFRYGRFHNLISECNPKVVIQVGSHVFVHGGITRGAIKYAHDRGRNVIEFANEVFLRHWNNGDLVSPINDPDWDILMAVSNPERGGDQEWGGMLWDDDLSSERYSNDMCSAEAVLILNDLNANLKATAGYGYVPVKHIVISHCQQFLKKTEYLGQIPANYSLSSEKMEFSTKGPDGAPRFTLTHESDRTINCLCDGLVWRVDVGMSRAMTIDTTELTPEQKLALKRSMLPAVLVIDEELGSTKPPEYTVRQSTTLLPGVQEA